MHIKKSDKRSARTLINAVKNNDFEKVKMLIEKINVNVKDEYDRTPLIHALIADDIQIFKLLLSAGADPHAKDIYGRSVYRIAEECCDEAVQILKNMGITE